jgi:hypothetical protein
VRNHFAEKRKPMTHQLRVFALTIVFVLAAAATSMAQSQIQPGGAPETSLRVSVLITRFDSAGTKLSTNPFEFSVIVNDRSFTTAPTVNFRMGSQVPVTSKGDGTWQFLNVGTNIDCTAFPASDGRFRLQLGVEDTAVIPRTEAQRKAGTTMPAAEDQKYGVPAIRSSILNTSLILREGQKSEYTATDKTSGEIIKVEVSFKVEK